MKLFATHKAEQNQAAIDPWTAVHFSAGLAAGLVDAAFPKSLLAAVAYELIEQVLERNDAGKAFFKTSGPEVLHNAVVDVAVFVVGHALGQQWNATGTRSASP